ncbi:hypothetical protein PILCRDRAFT_814206 [Piloderma croceum F 1598]|uniref:Uncharacterized protein n=1 Tax=Piloderma croceum (strain F 1598) TaxID=765440 RepID=A0A0C3BP92_PILCF|nr:hypothetical protein PILCRDRAFT_814206 [Piloderma croceum F 1598]
MENTRIAWVVETRLAKASEDFEFVGFNGLGSHGNHELERDVPTVLNNTAGGNRAIQLVKDGKFGCTDPPMWYQLQAIL